MAEMTEPKIRIQIAQAVALGAAIVSVALYAARVESKAVHAQTEVAEIKLELANIREKLSEQRVLLAEVKSDSKNILRNIEDLKKERPRP